MHIGALGLALLGLMLGPVAAWAEGSAEKAGAAPPPPALAQGSALAGLGFGDRPFALSDDGIFGEVLRKAAKDLQRACGAQEAFGWEIKPDDQTRVDKLTDSLVGALRKAKFVVQLVKPKSFADTDLVSYTADRSDRRLLFLLSLSPPAAAGQMAQMVVLICDTTRK